MPATGMAPTDFSGGPVRAAASDGPSLGAGGANNAVQQIIKVCGLREPSVNAMWKILRICLLRASAEDDDAGSMLAASNFKLRGEIEAGDVWQFDVQENYIWFELGRSAQRGRAIAGG